MHSVGGGYIKVCRLCGPPANYVGICWEENAGILKNNYLMYIVYVDEKGNPRLKQKHWNF